jgi:hypothetical protein
MRAIPSVYYGNKRRGPQLTRSRAEAYWLATLDGLQIPYEFEKQRYLKPINPKTGNSFSYLPDIFLPLQNLWLEVKGTFYGNEFEMTDPYCLWQGYNEQLFNEIRTVLADPSKIVFTPDEETYVDVWGVAGNPEFCEVMQFVRAPLELDCFDAEFSNLVTQTWSVDMKLGLCPTCSNLVLFSEQQHFPKNHNDDGQITVDCNICGNASFWPHSNSNSGRLAAICEARNKVLVPFQKAAKFACSSSANIVTAVFLNEENTLVGYTPKGTTKQLTFTVYADPFTKRRGVV